MKIMRRLREVGPRYNGGFQANGFAATMVRRDDLDIPKGLPMRWIVISWILIGLATCQVVSAGELLSGFVESPEFGEQVRWSVLPSGVRVHLSASQTHKADERVLVVYATPNGSTIEQTLGCKAAEGIDWRFDIQHVAAQMRLLRATDTKRDYVLAVVQAPKLSWPAFRRDEKQAAAIIPALLDSLVADTKATSLMLTCHSGGGSFLFGTINTFDSLPDTIERIVFLDANYSYSDEDQHGDKLLSWLERDKNHRLVVIAYDDREVVLNGKKAIGPDGGTFRASQRMTARLKRDLELVERDHGLFQHTTGLGGQVQFFVHANPENKILHTALVGDMNGFVHALTLGTEHESKWGTFGGPRA